MLATITAFSSASCCRFRLQSTFTTALLCLPSPAAALAHPAAFHHLRMSSSSSSFPALPSPLLFGPYPLTPSQIFYRSKHSMAIVNLKPLVPNHVLVLPYRVVERFVDLTPQEVTDLYLSVHTIGPVLERHRQGKGLTISMQDGKAAGQTVPHVHVHVLPRIPGDFTPNDQIYEELEAVHLKKHFDLDIDRRPRTEEEMAEEARELRLLFPHNQ